MTIFGSLDNYVIATATCLVCQTKQKATLAKVKSGDLVCEYCGGFNEATMQGECFCKTLENESLAMSQWPDGDLPWTITDLLPGMTLEEMKADLAWGYDVWAKICGIRPRYTANASEARVLIGTRSIDGPSKVLAETELPNGQRQVRMWLDTGESWKDTFDDGSNRIILQLVGCHEEGHSIGFGHAPDKPEIMAPYYNAQQRAPGPWDIQQGTMRYGKPVIVSPPVPPAPTPVRPSGGVFVDEATVRAAIQKALAIAGWVAKATTPTWDDQAVAFLSQDFVVNLLVMLFTKFGNNLGAASPKAIEEAILAHLAGA